MKFYVIGYTSSTIVIIKWRYIMNTQSRLKLAALAASTLFVTQLHAEPSGKGNGETPNGVPFKHLQEQIDQNKTDLDALAASTGASIASIEADVMLIQQDISDLAARITANENDIAVLQSDVDANASQISALEAETAALQSDLDNLEASLASKQDVLDGSCPVNSSLRVIYPDGSFICEVDTSDTYQSILVRVGGYVPVSSSYSVMRRAVSGNCPSGYFAVSGGPELRLLGTGRNVNISSSKVLSTSSWEVNFSRAYGNGFNYVRVKAMCLRRFN